VCVCVCKQAECQIKENSAKVIGSKMMGF
jgi:hypothetical protein